MLITPENKKKLARFKEIKRGYYSLIVVLILIVFSLFAEFFINNKALIVSYQGEYYFPVLGKFYSGETFGLDYSYEADYKELKKISQEKADLNLAPHLNLAREKIVSVLEVQVSLLEQGVLNQF